MLSEGSPVTVFHVVRPLTPAEKNGGAEDCLRAFKADGNDHWRLCTVFFQKHIFNLLSHLFTIFRRNFNVLINEGRIHNKART